MFCVPTVCGALMDDHTKPFAVGPALLANGYSPMPLRPVSQAPFLPDWTRLCREPLPAREVQRYALSPVTYNVGLALGHRGLIAVDRDTDDAAVIDALRPIFTAIYRRGGVPVAKFGSKGRTSFCRWSGPAPFRNRTFVAQDSSALGTFFEISGHGRSTTLPPSIHPKTIRSYTWCTPRTLLNTRAYELPELTAADVCAIEAALAPFLSSPKPAALPRASISVADLPERECRRQLRYVLAIIERESSTLAAMPPNSGRNRTVFNLACRVGRFVHHGIIEHRRVVEPILSACEANGLVREDGRAAVLKTINSGLARSSNDTLPDLRVGGGPR